MLVLLGSNHRSAPVALRERMAFGPKHVRDALARLTATDSIDEAFILSTCNRVELVARTSDNPGNGARRLRQFLADQHGIDDKELDRYAYQLQGREVVRHLFRVAAGLDSMILGEPQILGQVKQAYTTAKEQEALGPVLDRLLQHCFAAAKRARSETGISRHAVSVAYAAVELARKIFGELEGRSALLLGAGKMSELLARHLAASGVRDLVVASRTFNHAVVSAEEVGGRAVHWDDGLSLLSRVDIVVSCTGAPRQVVSRQRVASALKERRSRTLFLIDIAVPRDIDPQVNELDNAYLYDIDALQGVIETNLEERRRAAEHAEKLIEEEVQAFERWRQSLGIAPLIVSLRESTLKMGRREIERFRRKLGPMTPQQERAVEDLTRAVINKFLHRPVRHLRESIDRGDMERCSSLFREIFDVTDRLPAEPEPPGEGSTKQGPPGPRRVFRGGREE